MSVKSFDEYFLKIESEIKIKNSDHASIYLTEKKTILYNNKVCICSNNYNQLLNYSLIY